jgi:putative oxidoreductase
MKKLLGPHAELIYAINRIVIGFLYWLHGTTKLFDWPPGARASGAVELFSLLGAAAVIETVLGAFIILGLFTRVSAFICSGQMAAAYFIRQWPVAFLPIYLAPTFAEVAVVNCFFFLYVAAKGAGMLSLDRLFGFEKEEAVVRPASTSV